MGSDARGIKTNSSKKKNDDKKKRAIDAAVNPPADNKKNEKMTAAQAMSRLSRIMGGRTKTKYASLELFLKAAREKAKDSRTISDKDVTPKLKNPVRGYKRGKKVKGKK